MNKTFLTIIFEIVTVCCFGQHIETLTIQSNIYGNREIMVYTPRRYENHLDKKYEVVYVFDAQARQYFDYVHSSLTFLKSSVPMIVVGIVSKERDDDFLPTYQHSETAKMMGDNLGSAHKFIKFLKDDVFPYINNNYRVLPTRLALGHSNGGVFITYCLLVDPSMFDGYLAISPHMRYDRMQMIDRLNDFNPEIIRNQKFYYMTKANESGKDWQTSIDKTKSFFQSEKVKNVLHYEYDYFPNLTHTSIYPQAVINGLNRWFDYRYNDVERFKEYYTKLKENHNYKISEQELLGHISNFFWAKEYPTAKSIIDWGKSLYPNSELLSYFDDRFEDTEAKKTTKNFPEKCIGVWEGTMKIYSYNTVKDSVKVRFTVAKTNLEGTYTWKTEYLSETTPMVKDYKLIVNDLKKGKYILDEGDGSELIQYNVENKLYSLFKVKDIWLTSTTELADNKIIFEVTSGKEVNEIIGIKNYSFSNMQRLVMRRSF